MLILGMSGKLEVGTSCSCQGEVPGQSARAWAPGGEQPIVSLNPAAAAAKSLQSSGGEKGLRGSGAGTLGVPLEGTRRVGVPYKYQKINCPSNH